MPWYPGALQVPVPRDLPTRVRLDEEQVPRTHEDRQRGVHCRLPPHLPRYWFGTLWGAQWWTDLSATLSFDGGSLNNHDMVFLPTHRMLKHCGRWGN